ncbi:MAG: hypothetical protein ACUVSS_16075, partial [Anaerolineae bacterium]
DRRSVRSFPLGQTGWEHQNRDLLRLISALLYERMLAYFQSSIQKSLVIKTKSGTLIGNTHIHKPGFPKKPGL